MSSFLLKFAGFFCCLFLIKYYSFFYITLPVREFIPNGSTPTIVTFLIYNFGLSVLYYPFKFIVIVTILTFGIFLNKKYQDQANFGKLLTLAVSAEFIFLLSDVVKILYFTFYTTSYHELQFANFYPLSLFNLLNTHASSSFSYAFQVLNGFECIYIIYLVNGVSNLTEASFEESLGMVSYSYGFILIIWVLMVTCLNL